MLNQSKEHNRVQLVLFSFIVYIENYGILCYYIRGEIMKKILTLIIDGIANSDKEGGNSIKMANMPTYKKLLEDYPNTLLKTSGPSVGLSENQPGNEEVGYKTLGAGKLIRQRSSFVNDFMDVDSLATNGNLKSAVDHARKNKSTIHVIGLMSDSGVESSIHDTIKLLEYLKTQEVDLVLDVIADGKNVEAKSALKYIEMLDEIEVPIATICGRYYAMDTEEKWDRVKIYYDLIRNGVGLKVKEVPLALKNCYIRNITDEFLPPIIATQDKNLKNGDVVIWVNYESESSKEILFALSNPKEITEFDAVLVDNLKLYTMYPVSEKIESTPLIEEEDDVSNSLTMYLSKLGLTQARIATRNNYDYVTYYFNGETDEKIPKCSNYLVEAPSEVSIESLKIGTENVTKQTIKCMEKDTDFIIASFDCVDKIAHTGSLENTIEVLEYVDECLDKILKSASMNFYTVVITSTHGIAEDMILEDGKPSTTHTTNEVPLIITDTKLKLIPGSLKSVTPTLLKYMDIGIPETMRESEILIEEN